MFKTRAFTLIEIIIVLVIIGVIAAIGIPGINQARANAEKETMRTRAVQLQTAKLALVTATGRDEADAQWTAQANNANRYANLLRQYLPSTFPSTLTGTGGLIPSPFNIDLGSSIDASVTLTDGNNTVIPLQKY